MKLKTVLKDAVVFSLLISAGIWGAATLAAPNADGSDVVVKKNADGSVDAYDAGQSAAPSADNTPTLPRRLPPDMAPITALTEAKHHK